MNIGDGGIATEAYQRGESPVPWLEAVAIVGNEVIVVGNTTIRAAHQDCCGGYWFPGSPFWVRWTVVCKDTAPWPRPGHYRVDKRGVLGEKRHVLCDSLKEAMNLYSQWLEEMNVPSATEEQETLGSREATSL